MSEQRTFGVGPKEPVLLLAVMTSLVAWMLATGLQDVFLPTLRGEAPFGELFRLTDRYGPAYLFAHVYFHNLGLACLVPGVGFLAGAFEEDPQQRKLIAPILLVTSIATIFVGVQYLFQTGMAAIRPLLGLAALESLAVLLLSFATYPHLRRYEPTPAIGWSLAAPMRRLRPWFAASALLLLVASIWETWMIFGA